MSFGKYIADDELESGDDDGPIAFEVGAARTVLARARDGGKELWSAELESQPVAMYRVLHDATTGEAMLVELTARSSSNRDLVRSDSTRKHGVHVLTHQDQIYAVPESAYVAPLYTVAPGELSSDIKTFYNVKKAEKTPRLIAPPSKDDSKVEEDEDESLVLIGASAVGGLVVVALLLWWFSRGKPPVVVAPVVAPEPEKPARKMAVSESVLGYGSCGTVVYEGRLDGRKIAVKRMLKDFYALAEKESEILLRGDAHPNVVSYFLKEEDDRFVYLGLSYCSLTVGDMFESEETLRVGGNDNNESFVLAPRPDCLKAKAAALSNERRLLNQLAAGLAHLHALGVVHRDLKPHNILLDEDGNVKISDMGLARRLDPQNHSFSTLSSGTVGYQAPEVLLGQRQSFALDVWGFGCLTYFVLSKGFHPFGSRVHREANILANKINLVRVTDPVALHLISKCLQSEAQKRPSMMEVLQHPLFWDKHKRLLFLLDVSDLLEALEGNIPETEAFERYMHGHVLKPQSQWHKMIAPKLLGDMGKYRKYTNSIKDLLRLVRNKSHHYRDLAPDLQELLGSHPEGYLDYFCRLFPRLFIQAYKFVLASRHKTEPTFARYFA